MKRGDLSINKGYNTIRAREKAASAPDRGEPALDTPKEEPTPAPSLSVSKPIDFKVLVDRLRTKLGVEVALALDGTGESGRVSFCFGSRDDLIRVIEKICSSEVRTSMR